MKVPKHPTPENLGEYASGSLDEALREEIARHIESCPQCAGKAETAQRLDATLRAGLSGDDETPGGDCLAAAVLAEYIDGTLSSERGEEADRHLAECSACRENLIEILSAIKVNRDKGFAELDEDARKNTLDLIAAELGEKGATCPSCGKGIEPGASLCAECGANRETGPAVLLCMFCRRSIPSGSRFCPLCGVAIAPPKKNFLFLFSRRQGLEEMFRAHIWFILSAAAMTASFFVSRYFKQCIAIALIFGAKWVLDQAQFRIYDEILKSLKKSDEPGQSAKPRKRKSRRP